MVRRSKTMYWILSMVLLVSLASGIYCTPGPTHDPPSDDPGAAAADTTPSSAAASAHGAETLTPAQADVEHSDAPRPAMRVYRDPETGRIGPLPPNESTVDTPESLRAASTSAEGLTEEASPVEGGGTMIDLQGRFRSVVEGRVDANGNVSSECDTEPQPDESDEAGEEG